MKISAKLPVILLASSMAFSAVGCKGEPPEPPRQVGEADVSQAGIELSVASFELASPDFIDRDGHAMRPSADESEVAVLRLKIKNTSSSEIQYKPLHFESADKRIQVCTDPDPDTGARSDIKAIAFESGKGTHTPAQHIEPRVAIPAGSEIIDEYLFEPPVVAGGQKLIVLVPGTVVGVQKTFRFYLDMPKRGVQAEPSKLNEAATVDDVSVTVTKVGAEYPELEPKDEKLKEGLKYAYAYTAKPVLAIHIKIDNKSSTDYGYNPSHAAEIAGINLNMPGNISLKRVKLDGAVYGKGQVANKVALKAGETIEDVFFFDMPGDSTPLEFSLSGHIFGVRGIYRFKLDYEKTTPAEPDLTPYKSAGNADNAAAEEHAAADANGGDNAEAKAEEKKDEAKADEKKDEPKAEEKKADDKKSDKKKKK